MSNPLAIAAVTAVLKDLLTDGLLDYDLSWVGRVYGPPLPPGPVATGANEPNQLNLFLYHLTPNLGWRNEGLPSRDTGGNRLTNAPLALDLHYLLTSYGTQDLNAEVLLGFAMQMLHETQVLTRQRLRAVLGTPSPFGTLSALDLADQIELVKISPVFLNTEELSKMWTAMQSRYRPTMAYTVSVVLIEADQAVKSAPPVLQRGQGDTGATALAAPFPSLSRVGPAASDLLPAIRLGDDLRIAGACLDAAQTPKVRFENDRAQLVRELAPLAPLSPRALRCHLPSPAEDADAMHAWAIGMYSVALEITPAGRPAWSTNSVPVALAPRITVSPASAAAGDLTLTVTCAPRLQARQEARARLLFGPRTLAPSSISTPLDPKQPTTLTFKAPAATPGEYLVRLRVDGIDSLPVAITGSPSRLEFDPSQKVTVT
jgi:hypothetical protein